MPKISICIVGYNTNRDVLLRCIDAIENQNFPEWNGVFVDHSEKSIYAELFTSRTRWKYLDRSKFNLGYGAGNNFGFKNIELGDYVLVLNPDLYLFQDAITKLLNQTSFYQNLGLLTGKITYPDGSLQRLNKKNPNVVSLLARRFPIFQRYKWIKNSLDDYEMKNFNYDNASDIEFISGCLMFIPRKIWIDINGFDDRFFIYFEDADLTRRIRNLGYQTIYAPVTLAIHEYQRGSHKSVKLFLLFISSMYKYFSKWGWKWR